MATYKNIIAQNFGAMPEKEFESHVRDILIIQKLQENLRFGIIITSNDVEQRYKQNNTLMKFACAPVPLSNFMSSVSVTTNEVEEFYNQYPEQFRMPASVSLVYARIYSSTNDVVIDPQDAEFYYDDHYNDFIVTNTVVSATGTNTVVETLPYSNVVNEIYTILTARRAEERARDKADTLYIRTSEMTDSDVTKRMEFFTKEAEKLGLETVETSPLVNGASLPGIVGSRPLVTAAHSMDVGTASDVQTLPDGSLVIFAVADKIPSTMPAFADAYSNIYENVVTEKAFQMAANVAQRVKNQIDMSTNDFLTTVRRLGWEPIITKPLSPNDSFTAIRCPQQVVQGLFSYPEGSTVVAPYAEGVMIVTPLTVYEADMALMYVEEEKLQNAIYQTDLNILFQGYFSKAQQNTRIIQNAFNRLKGIDTTDDSSAARQ